MDIPYWTPQNSRLPHPNLLVEARSTRQPRNLMLTTREASAVRNENEAFKCPSKLSPACVLHSAAFEPYVRNRVYSGTPSSIVTIVTMKKICFHIFASWFCPRSGNVYTAFRSFLVLITLSVHGPASFFMITTS